MMGEFGHWLFPESIAWCNSWTHTHGHMGSRYGCLLLAMFGELHVENSMDQVVRFGGGALERPSLQSALKYLQRRWSEKRGMVITSLGGDSF